MPGNLTITLNGQAWDSSTKQVQTGDKSPLSWTIEVTIDDSGTLLLNNGNGAIDPTQWLDIAMVIPFTGNLWKKGD